jgi:predicted nucleic acid-binding Zn ribbon protein
MGIDTGPRRLDAVIEESLPALAPPPVAAAGGSGALGAVFSRWEEIVGTAVAAHARPLRMTGGTLVVAVDHPAWATQVRALGETLRERVGAVTGATPEVVRVVVRRADPGADSRP